MSAIFGIINKKQEYADSSLVGKMLEALNHRAPDGSQIVVDKNMGMGNCRLNVYPQQIYEKQPLKIGQFTITADTRIDNRQELARHFNIDNDMLSVTPDSTLILMAYQEWEDMCINHLEGEFAFAIWDEKSEKLFAATDHIGFRPLYYYDTPDAFIFCSEIKGITAIKATPNYFNEEYLIEYFYKHGNFQQTFNKEILVLYGGNVMIMKDGKLSIKKYWTLEPANRYHFTKNEEWYECLKELMYKAVEKRLNYDVPIGLTLSGGLDSGSIACILSELLMKKNKPLYTFSSVLPNDYNGTEKDEREYIEIIGKHCPNIIQTYESGPGLNSFTNLEESFNRYESFPSSTSYMDIALLKAAQKKDVKILFSGFGGDYWVSWSGNSVIYELIKRGNLQTAFKLIKQFMKNDNKSFTQVFREMYASRTSLYKTARSIIKGNNNDKESEVNLLNEKFIEKYVFFRKEQELNETVVMRKLTNNGSISQMSNIILTMNETMGMTSALPLFDKNIFELLNELPIHLFVNGGWKRALIRNAMKDVNPSEINERKNKLPFSPECIKRAYDCKEHIQNLINDPDSLFILDKYIDKNKMIHYMEKMSLAYSSTNTSIIPLRILQAGIVTEIILYLKDNNYIFN
jgi:asparagine synthase (glutamine-hydrolysing)